MRRRGGTEIAIVGGGVVGSACALALAALDLQVVLVEAAPPPAWQSTGRDLRVYAFSPDNAALLERFGLWTGICTARAQPYRGMRVWDAAGGNALVFDADAFARSELGWIVEHGLLADRLWRALPGAGVEVRAPAQVHGCTQDDDGVRLALDDGSRVDARLAVAADGAESSLRRLASIDVAAHDYGQRGVVCFVGSERPHGAMARQRFLPGGPLALLPFADGDCSIVWTLPEDEAARIMALDDERFGVELTRASDRCLGALRPTSTRAAFPLRRQLAQGYRQGRVLLVGDAAHVVHPLAGQGVNLGLRDVAALADSIGAALARRQDYDTPQRLQRWARQRRSENALAAHGFEAIDRLFRSHVVLPALLRGPFMGAVTWLPPLTRGLWRRASGL